MGFPNTGSVDLGSAFGSMLIDWSGVKREADKQLNNLDKSIANSLNKIGSRMQRVGANLTVGLAPITAFVTQGTLAYAEFDDILTEIEARTGSTAAEMDMVRRTAVQMGQDTAFSASEASQAMLELLSSGYNLNETMAALKPTLDLAAAGKIGLGQAADAVSDILAQFQLEAEQAGMVANVLAQASQASSASVEQLVAGFANVGPTANMFKLSVEDTAAILAMFAENGIKGAEAGTLLKSMLSGMSRPTKEVQETFKELGVNLFDSTGTLRDFNTVIEELSGKMDDLSDQDRIRATQALAGAYGQQGLAALTASEGFDEMRKKMREQADAAEVAKKMMSSFRGVINQVASSVNTFSIVFLGPMLERYIKPLFLPIAWIINQMTAWAMANEDLAAVLGLVTLVLGGLGPVLLAVGTFVNFMGTTALPLMASGIGSYFLHLDY